MLTDLGADVIKVESGKNLDLFRLSSSEDRSDGWRNRAPLFRFSNRNKRGICLDLKTEEGHRLIGELIDQSDVVVENFRRGVLERLGLGYQSISQTNPRIVLASISSQGDTGPNRLHTSFGSTLDASGGLAAMTGYADGTPEVSGGGLNYPDQIVSLFATGTIVAAVKATRRTGRGVQLDISQREIASFLIGEELVASAASVSKTCTRLRRGNAQDGVRLQDCYLCEDGRWVAVTINDAEALAQISALPGWPSTDDPAEALRNWCAVHPAAAAQDALRSCGVAAATVLDGDDLLRDSALWGNTIVDMGRGEVVKGMPYVFGGRGYLPKRLAPALGEHTGEVLREILGTTVEEIERLLESGVTSGRTGLSTVQFRIRNSGIRR